MRHARLSAVVFKVSGVVYILAGGATAIVAAILKLDLAWWEEKWPAGLQFVQAVRNAAPLMLVLSMVSAGAAKCLRDATGRPKKWQSVHQLLDALQRLAFGDFAQTDPLHHHRVTLFRAVRWKRLPQLSWHCHRWLVAYERSGHMTRDSKTAFRIPDDADHVEGIAGQTWAMNQVVLVSGLPDTSAPRNDADWQDYAKKTFVDVSWLREAVERRPLARSYCGIPVEVRGRLWGVLVFDSRSDRPIEAVRVYKEVGQLLGGLLER